MRANSAVRNASAVRRCVRPIAVVVLVAWVGAGNCAAQETASAVAAAPVQDEMRHLAFIGKTRKEVGQYEFFTFFRLEKIKEWQDPAMPGMTFAMYGQSGNFKGQVLAAIVSNTADDRIVHASASISRQFIDSPQTGRFARDFAKSFLELAPEPAPPEVGGLWSEVWHGCVGKAANFANQTGKFLPDACPAESQASMAYRVYLGKDAAYRLVAPGASSVFLHNATQGGTSFLQIDIGRE